MRRQFVLGMLLAAGATVDDRGRVPGWRPAGADGGRGRQAQGQPLRDEGRRRQQRRVHHRRRRDGRRHEAPRLGPAAARQDQDGHRQAGDDASSTRTRTSITSAATSSFRRPSKSSSQENTKTYMDAGEPGLRPRRRGPQPNLFKQNGGKGMPKRTFKDKMTHRQGRGPDRPLLLRPRPHRRRRVRRVPGAPRDARRRHDPDPRPADHGQEQRRQRRRVTRRRCAKAAAGRRTSTRIINGHNPTTTTPADMKTLLGVHRRLREVRPGREEGRQDRGRRREHVEDAGEVHRLRDAEPGARQGRRAGGLRRDEVALNSSKEGEACRLRQGYGGPPEPWRRLVTGFDKLLTPEESSAVKSELPPPGRRHRMKRVALFAGLLELLAGLVLHRPSRSRGRRPPLHAPHVPYLVETTIPAIQTRSSTHVITAPSAGPDVLASHRRLRRQTTAMHLKFLHPPEPPRPGRGGRRWITMATGEAATITAAGGRCRHPDDPQGQHRHARHADDRRHRGARRIDPAADAFIARKLREAGAIILGKATMTEFANFLDQRHAGRLQLARRLRIQPLRSAARSAPALDALLRLQRRAAGAARPADRARDPASRVDANLAAVGIGTETSGLDSQPGQRPTASSASSRPWVSSAATASSRSPPIRTPPARSRAR